MQSHTKRLLSGLLCVIAITSSTSSAWATDSAGPSSIPGTSSNNLTQAMVATIDGVSFTSGTPKSGLGGNSPKLLGLIDWLQCRSYSNSTWTISSFSTTYLGASRVMRIQCGSGTTHGYLHIADGNSDHQKGWRLRITQANPADNTDIWDDFMWWAAQKTWANPETSLNLGNGKVCRSAPIDMSGRRPDGSSGYKYTFRPTFIWSITDNRLITAIPSTATTC